MRPVCGGVEPPNGQTGPAVRPSAGERGWSRPSRPPRGLVGVPRICCCGVCAVSCDTRRPVARAAESR
eukprot:scaffold14363_cov111-Isochrysis_galbana.AAC.5